MSRLIYGIQPAREAIRVHGPALESVWIERGSSPKLVGLARFAEGRGVSVRLVHRSELDRLTTGGRHQGTAAFAPDLALVSVDDLPTEGALFVALDGVIDPQNFGASVRSAVALGATAVLWPEHASAPLSPAMFRASAGAVEHATLCRVPSLPDALSRLGERGVQGIVLDAEGPADLGALDLRPPTVLVIGAEDRGARKAVRRACAHAARLPMGGPIASLNASVACAIALYEAARQRSG